MVFLFPSKGLHDFTTPFGGKHKLDRFAPSPRRSTRKPPTRMPEEMEQIASRCAVLEIPRAAYEGVSCSSLPTVPVTYHCAGREGGEQDVAFLSLGT